MKNVLVIGTLALLAACSGVVQAPEGTLQILEQAVTIGAATWAILKFILTPLLAQMVRKAVNHDLARIEVLEAKSMELGIRVNALELQVEEHGAVFRELPLLRESMAATREAVTAVKESLDRVLDLVEEQQRALGRLEGRAKED